MISTVPVNLALKQFTNQSSTLIHNELPLISGAAVDGSFFAHFNSLTLCSHTLRDKLPWFLIVLQKPRVIRQIRILNRYYFHERLSKLFIKTKMKAEHYFTDYDTDFKLFSYMPNTIAAAASESFTQDIPHFARTVLFYIEKTEELAICEIEMWSLKYLTKNNLTEISSSYLDQDNKGKAYDGNSNGDFNIIEVSCSHSKRGKNNWWKVDLQRKFTVFAVSIIGRANFLERLSDINIDVSKENKIPSIEQKPRCGSVLGQAPPSTTINCPKWTVGQYIEIIKFNQSDDEPLTLCEVDIFGYELQQNIRVIFFLFNETISFTRNSTKENDCHGNIKQMIEIFQLKLNSFKVDVKGIGIKQACYENKIIIIASLEENGYNINVCQQEEGDDGYFTSPDMFDTCVYYCNIQNRIIHKLSVYVSETDALLAKEIYIFVHI